MEVLFLYFLNSNIVLALLIITILILRILIKKISKQISLLLWGIVAIKCMLPFTFESQLSLIPSAQFFDINDIYTYSFQINSGISVIDSFVNQLLGSRYYEGVTVPTGTMMTTVNILSVIWILGIIILSIGFIVNFLNLKRKLCLSIKYKNNIWQCDMITSPFVFGVIRPRIYIPFNLKDNEIQYIVLHENEHIKHGDHIWKLISYLLLIINWYNPLIWIAYKIFSNDIEIACDERVVKKISKSDRKDYAKVLLKNTVNKTLVLGDQLYFGRENIKERVKYIIGYKKSNRAALIISLVLLMIVSIGFLTNPENANVKSVYEILATTFIN